MLKLETIAKNTTQKGFLKPDLGHSVEIPYWVLKGKLDGPTLVVTAGVHGAEYASIEAANQLTKLDTETLAGTLIILPIVNTPAFWARSIYINPVDQKNLNRLFPGKQDGSFGDKLAYWLTETFISKADAYIDLHGGDMIEALEPFTIYNAGHAESKALAEAFGIYLLVESDSEYMSISAGPNLGVPAILAEASGQGLWPEEEVERLHVGIVRTMQHLGMLSGEAEVKETKLLTEFAWLRAEHEGLWYPKVEAGDRVTEGQVIGQLNSLLGEPLQQAVSPIEGVILFSVSSLAINNDDPLFGIAA